MNPMSCMECRPHWQSFRRRVDEAGVPAERRGLVIQEYLRLLHDHDHDEAQVRATLARELTIQQAAALAHRLAEERAADGTD